jgi:ABC-type sugar transport system permease subunit
MTDPQRRSTSPRASDALLGWALVLPAVGIIALIALFPIVWTVWESLHEHDLRMPWLGQPFIGAANYREAFADSRFRGALAHTLLFVAITVSVELAAGLAIAVALDRVSRAREIVRTAILLPWAIPTVVAALVWRFIFESPSGLATTVAAQLGMSPPTWFADRLWSWLPIILADVWKTTPFVALLLLASLQSIDRSLYEAADVDGATPVQQFVQITLPLVRPAILVALLFRALDAFRVFDVIYVMTAGGPGTSTEPIALYAFSMTLRNLRFGFGAAISVIIFTVALLLAVTAIGLLRDEGLGNRAA